MIIIIGNDEGFREILSDFDSKREKKKFLVGGAETLSNQRKV